MGRFLSVSFYECQVKCFRLPDGSLMKITKVYALDAVFDNPEDVPEDVSKKCNHFIEHVKYGQVCLP